jgi:hypothetical protein
MGHTIFKPHHHVVLLSERIEKVLILLSNTSLEGEPFPKNIYDNLRRIYTRIQYTAPEIIGMCNEEFGCECIKHVDAFKKFNVNTQIQNIMQGKDI